MQVEINVPDGVSGDWKVSSFEVNKSNRVHDYGNMFRTGRFVPDGKYKKLTRCGTVIMSNTPDEINDHFRFVCRATGRVLINGLGLGVVLKMLLDKPEVIHITVIEKSIDVIKLVAPTYKDDRVTIIQADAFEYKPPKGVVYDCVWHDIWDYITTDNLPEMKKLHRKYGRVSQYQGSWARYLCEEAGRKYKIREMNNSSFYDRFY